MPGDVVNPVLGPDEFMDPHSAILSPTCPCLLKPRHTHPYRGAPVANINSAQECQVLNHPRELALKRNIQHIVPRDDADDAAVLCHEHCRARAQTTRDFV